MNSDLDCILIKRDQIAARVRELAADVAKTYQGSEVEGLTLVPILSGSLIFVADLIRRLPLRMKLGLITVSSYRGATTQAGQVRLKHELNADVRDRHVLLIDDILDTGGTLRMVRQLVAEQSPKTVRICVLLRKPTKAPPDVVADFVGFDIEDRFVVGYGLDYNDHYRNLPDIGVLRRELYAPEIG